MRTAIVAPLYHSAPASYGMQSLLFARILLIEPNASTPSALLADIERHRLDRLYLVPTHFVRLLRLPDEVKRRYDLSSIEFVASTGSPCPPEVKNQMIDWWGPVINESYAAARRASSRCSTAAEARTHPGSAGRPLRGAEVRILDDEGEVLPPFEPGLIYCRQDRRTRTSPTSTGRTTAARSSATGSWRSATSAISTATAISTSATASPTW